MNDKTASRIADLVRTIDFLVSDLPSLEGMDINEIMGMYDGRMMAIRDAWTELTALLGGTSLPITPLN